MDASYQMDGYKQGQERYAKARKISSDLSGLVRPFAAAAMVD